MGRLAREGDEEKERRDEKKEDCRRSRSTRERHSGPGWSPVNLPLILLSAQISSEDVLGPTSPRPHAFYFLSTQMHVTGPSFPVSLLCRE